MKHKTELLAPAGTYECFLAAVRAGADAVYLGGSKFGARAFAGNFTEDEIIRAIRYGALFGVKIYLTVNTLLKEQEIAEVEDYIMPLYEAGLGGIIVQDMGVVSVCQRCFPDLEIHASTQMTVTDAKTARFLKEKGICRVVPARELSLKEVEQIKRIGEIEVETFIHGALCYCYSGQCLFSSFLGGRSGNRGRCAQPCRQPYEVTADGKKYFKKEAYPLSLKDMCTLAFLPKLIEAGIDSFKIEGRMKSPEYVAGVTGIYRKYIDLYEQSPDNWKVEKKDMELLSQLYIRSEISEGYYFKHNGKEMVTLDKPGYKGVKEEVLTSIREKYPFTEMTLPVNFDIILEPGQPMSLTAEALQTSVCVFGEIPAPAMKRPLSEADITKQLNKTGGSHFHAKQIQVTIKGDLFMPMGALNELRRNALETLENDILSKKLQRCDKIAAKEELFLHPPMTLNLKRPALHASVLFEDQANKILMMEEVSRIYLPSDFIFEDTKIWQQVKEIKEREDDFQCFLVLPAILRSYSIHYLESLEKWLKEEGSGLIDGIMCSSLSGLVWLKETGLSLQTALQHSVYIWNREAFLWYYRHFGDFTYTAPLEINRQGIFRLPTASMEVMAYGRIPMMVSAGCLRKTTGGCLSSINVTGKNSHMSGNMSRHMDQYLTDRMGTDFPVAVNCRHCMNTIFNSVPLSLHNYRTELMDEDLHALRLDFTNETAEETENIVKLFSGHGGTAPISFTTGHYKKGAE